VRCTVGIASHWDRAKPITLGTDTSLAVRILEAKLTAFVHVLRFNMNESVNVLGSMLEKGADKSDTTRELMIPPSVVVPTLEKHLLLDGFRIVVDLEKSCGSRLVDAASGRSWVDFYGFYGSMAVGFNHPRFAQPEVRSDLLRAAQTKVANSDVYSTAYATFVKVFNRVMGLPGLDRYFFIEGGALAVENALKAAMDWKVRKNMTTGRGTRGTEILHFERAFHGRSGYTLSLTNTDPRKTDLFAKFNWPRVPSPRIDFALLEPLRTETVMSAERHAEAFIREILDSRACDIAAIIIEPIQGEGGDNHFRGEWLATLRRICDEYILLLIFDEVQTGHGTTGRNWCCEHFNVLPDLLAFGKKAQVCGVMAGPRLDEVPENCFRLPGRINSTWGGNLLDMVRATHCLQIIEEENLVENSRLMGNAFLAKLQELSAQEPLIAAPRGRGLMVAFDLPDSQQRDAFYQGLYEIGLLALRCGERSIRFRPSLDITSEAVSEAIEIIRAQCRRMRGRGRIARVLDESAPAKRKPRLSKGTRM
jgi:L-lysine 6-transaminase